MFIAGTLLAGLTTVGVRAGGDSVDHPDAWDPRVADLVGFVEDARGLDFDHPVHVDFLTAAEYTEATTFDEELQAEELADLEQDAGELRALGLLSGELDLVDALNQITDSGTLAFYSTEDKRVTVRGTEVTPALRVTLVHELTHALQDQHFDLGALDDPDEDDDSSYSSAGSAFRALAEGDAMRIEDDYVESLSDEDGAAYEDENDRGIESSEAALTAVPAFIQALFATPYALGGPFVETLYVSGRTGAVNDAFENPPTSEEHVFDPASFLAGDGVDDVDHGLDPDEVEVLDEGSFDISSWFLVLAERIDPSAALTATLGWAGDAYGTYTRDGTTCVRAVFAGDRDEDENEMAAALDDWVAAMPGGEAERVEVDGRPGIDACDPGPEVDMEVTDRSLDALGLVAVYGYLSAQGIDEGFPTDEARCIAEAAATQIPFGALSDEDNLEGLQGEVIAAVGAAVVACQT